MADPKATAEANVELKYGPQQAALERALQANQAEVVANEAGINTYGQQGRTAIGDVYNTLGGLLGANRTDSRNALQQQVANINQGYDTADAVARQAAQEGRDRISTLAAQLGQQAAGLEVMNPMEALIARLTGRSAQERAAATGNLGTWAAQWDQILGQGINIGEQSRAKALSELEAEIAKMLGMNKVTGLQGQNDIYGKMSDILSARQNDLIAMYNQLMQQEWENSFRQAQLDQDAAAKNASLGLEREKMQMSAEMAAADRADRAASRSSAGQLSIKDLIGIAMDQQQFEAGQADKQYARQTDARDYQLKRMLGLAGLEGDSGPDGNQLLLDWQSKLSGAGAPPTPQMIQEQANFYGSLGYPVEFFSGAQSTAPGARPTADPNMRNPNTGWQYMPFYGYTETRIGPGGVKQYR